MTAGRQLVLETARTGHEYRPLDRQKIVRFQRHTKAVIGLGDQCEFTFVDQRLTERHCRQQRRGSQQNQPQTTGRK